MSRADLIGLGDRYPPFRHKARSPQVRTHSFIAQPPDLRHLTLITRALRLLARSPCSAAPSIRFLSIGSQFMLHASLPHSVALVQLQFASLTVTNLRRDLHPQECAHAARTKKKAHSKWARFSLAIDLIGKTLKPLCDAVWHQVPRQPVRTEPMSLAQAPRCR